MSASQETPVKGEIIKIDLDGVLRDRLPRLSRLIPRFVVEWMKRTICQTRLNELLEENASLEGAPFARGVLRSLNITLAPEHEERLPEPSHRRVLYVSNHPLGGLDGMALIDYVQRRHGGNVYFVVNDLLQAVAPLRSVFLPVNKFGRQSREAIQAVEEAFAGDDPIIMFPAGLVSRLQKVRVGGNIQRRVCDLKWNKMFVNEAVKHQRDVIPLFFGGENSPHFYKMANRRLKLRLKFNFEMIYLPGEMFTLENSTLPVTFGSPVPWQQLTVGSGAPQCAARMRRLIYRIAAGENPAFAEIPDASTPLDL